MIKDPNLNFDMTKVGGLVSIMPVAYACSKFVSGVIGARTSPVVLLAGAARLIVAAEMCQQPLHGAMHVASPGTRLACNHNCAMYTEHALQTFLELVIH